MSGRGRTRGGPTPASEDRLIDAARAVGGIPGGGYRVMVDIEGRVTHHDFESLETATRYADDVASEGEDPHAVALVLDGSLAVVHRGTHYASAGDRGQVLMCPPPSGRPQPG